MRVCIPKWKWKTFVWWKYEHDSVIIGIHGLRYWQKYYWERFREKGLEGKSWHLEQTNKCIINFLKIITSVKQKQEKSESENYRWKSTDDNVSNQLASFWSKFISEILERLTWWNRRRKGTQRSSSTSSTWKSLVV